jgi:hypothetical protein
VEKEAVDLNGRLHEKGSGRERGGRSRGRDRKSVENSGVLRQESAIEESSEGPVENNIWKEQQQVAPTQEDEFDEFFQGMFM